eukprot:scaffold57778_cov49-Attheya_sp.AAC.1
MDLPNPNPTINITGWCSECNFDSDLYDIRCGGEKRPASILLDLIGQTCYLNPIEEKKTQVFLLGPSGTSTVGPSGLNSLWWVYTIFLNPNGADYDSLLPSNCTTDGACPCNSIDPIREKNDNNWTSTRLACILPVNTTEIAHDYNFASGMFGPDDAATPLQSTDCGIFVKISDFPWLTDPDSGYRYREYSWNIGFLS